MAELPADASGAKARNARSRKQRILWDSDNVTPDGKTSIGVLLEWLTAPGNYERWRDGKAQFGETREKLCTEINAVMKKHGITHRENANIRTQISELERSYDAAVAWLVQNGFEDGQLPELPPPEATAATNPDGVTTNSSHPAHHAEVQVLRLCRYFHVLSAIMRQPTHQPRARRPYNRTFSGSSATASRRTSGEAQRDGDSLGEEDSAMDTASENGHDASMAANGRKRKMVNSTQPLLASASTAAAAPVSTPGAQAPSVMMASNNFASFENTQRMLLDAAREDRDRKRFQLDEERNKLECEKLRYEIEAARLELAVQRVLARKKLMDAGVAAGDVDTLLAQTLS